MKWLVTVVILAAMAATLWWVAAQGTAWDWPDRHKPWAPLNVQDPPNWLTRFKLARLDRNPSACLAALETADFRFDALPDRRVTAQCGFSNAVRLHETQLQIGEPFSLSCPAAVSLALWERHVVLPQAERHFGRPVLRLHHQGSYACRNVYGRASGRTSQHATAEALDVSGFTLQGGRRITVSGHWESEGDAAAFLRAVHGGACGFFDGVLGPEYNAAHADHFHLDRGPYRICR